MSTRKTLCLLGAVACVAATFAIGEHPNHERGGAGNSYSLFTKELSVDDRGVAKVPSRFRWSVETNVAGFDAHGNTIPDARVMLRLYDPDRNFTAMTAQMDLPTATRLHQELGEVIAAKSRDTRYQKPFRHHYGQNLLPVGEMRGVDENGVAIIEFTYPGSTAAASGRYSRYSPPREKQNE